MNGISNKPGIGPKSESHGQRSPYLPARGGRHCARPADRSSAPLENSRNHHIPRARLADSDVPRLRLLPPATDTFPGNTSRHAHFSERDLEPHPAIAPRYLPLPSRSRQETCLLALVTSAAVVAVTYGISCGIHLVQNWASFGAGIERLIQ